MSVSAHDAFVFLAVAGLVVPLFKHYKVSPVIGFLLAGIIVGPYGLGQLVPMFPWLQLLLITDVEGVQLFAELGVVFLLFMIGLELSPKRLLQLRRLVLGLGTTQILGCASVIAICAWGFGNSLAAAIVLGSCLALSSTAIVVQLLIEQGRFGDAAGRGSFAVLLAQDLAVVPILFMVGTMGRAGTESVWGSLGLALLQATLCVAAILIIGQWLIRPLFRFVAKSKSPELFTAVTLLTIGSTAALTHSAGLSAALGAFLAGLLLAESEYSHEIELNIEPFKGLLLGLFFMSVAMRIDLAHFLREPLWLTLSVAGLFAIKIGITTLLARAFGYAWKTALEIGALLGQAGEFGFVIVGLALSVGLLPEATGNFMNIVIGASMLFTPAIIAGVRALTQHWTTDDASPNTTLDTELELKGHVIIVGYGRAGELLADLLTEQKIPFVGVDASSERVSAIHATGAPVYFADATRVSTLRKLGLPNAAVMVVCTDDHNVCEHVLQAAAQVAPNTQVIARARDVEHATSLLTRGAKEVVPEVWEAGLQLGQITLELTGIPALTARDLVDARRSNSRLNHGSLEPATQQPGD